MKPIRTAPAVVALVLAALVGCTVGGTGTPGSPPVGPTTSGATTGSATSAAAPTGTGEGAVGPDELAVEMALRQYQGALATGAYAAACSLYTPEAHTQLIMAVQADGAPVATCEDALITVFSQAGVPATAAEAATTMSVDDVVVQGLSATITWTSTRQGEPRTDTTTWQLVDGRWLLAGAA